jgi:hypothetical protein
MKALSRMGNTFCSVSSKCCKHSNADHSPGEGASVNNSSGITDVKVCQRDGVVDNTACAWDKRLSILRSPLWLI